jgi:hypothetical protein
LVERSHEAFRLLHSDPFPQVRLNILEHRSDQFSSSQFNSGPPSREVSPDTKRSQDVSLLVPKASPASRLYRGNLHCTSTCLSTLSSPSRRPWQIVLHFCHENFSTREQRVHCPSKNEPEQLPAKRTCRRGGAKEHKVLSPINSRRGRFGLNESEGPGIALIQHARQSIEASTLSDCVRSSRIKQRRMVG